MNNIKNQIEDLYKLHIAADDLRHGIKVREWKLFEPSQFIYAYFAFNSFYSINWEDSITKQEIIKWEITSEDNNNNENISESKKISSFIQFIYNSFVDESLSSEEKENSKQVISLDFSSKLKKRLKDKVNFDLYDIIVDININEEMKRRIINKYNALVNTELIGKKFRRALNTVLLFIYNVRNNIFHGTKNIIQMMDNQQRNRLYIYTSIILTINEMLFDAIEKRINWERRKIDRDNKYFYKETIMNKERKFTPSQLKNLNIPEGILFYPCSGNDTYEPIKYFIEHVSEFHFVDIMLTPQLPNFLCRNLRVGKYTVDLDLVKDITSFPPYDDNINEEKITQLSFRGIKSEGYKRDTGKIYKHELFLTNDKKVMVYCHVQDGIAVFSTLENISIFFLRGDSNGEGGSNQGWFRKNIFNYILDKLVDGGLIVTDGSSNYHTCPDVAWKGLWDKLSYENGNYKPCDFSYNDRNFKFLGEFGVKKRGTLIWQVERILKQDN